MGSPTYRYHSKLAPTGAIFDSDALPAESDGWADSPKRFTATDFKEKGKEPEAQSGEFPDPRPFFDVKSYIAAVNPSIPLLPAKDEAIALGMDADQLADLEADIVSKRRRALLYYAKRKYDMDLPRNQGPGKLFDSCVELDKAK